MTLFGWLEYVGCNIQWFSGGMLSVGDIMGYDSLLESLGGIPVGMDYLFPAG